MNETNDYLKSLPGLRRQRLTMVAQYIRQKYPNAVESMYYAPHASFPVFEVNKMHVSFAGMKHYISIYFEKPDAPKIAAGGCRGIKTGLCCVNIRDTVEFPLDSITQAVDFCFAQDD